MRTVDDRWEREAKPHGFRLAARVPEYPGGMPGDIGLFLVWGLFLVGGLFLVWAPAKGAPGLRRAARVGQLRGVPPVTIC